jgi:DnaJ-class molecular chaperone
MSSTALEDYYAVLGVPREADATELRRTFRKLALQYHPDRAGPSSTAAFQRIARAYEVLSDPLARASYDRRLRSEERKSSPVPNETRPSTPSPPRSEPRPTPPPAAPRSRTLLSRLSGPLNSLIACGVVRKCEDGTFELHLSEEESRQGGYATISMYARLSCKACGGKEPDRASCPQCKGEGASLELVSAWITLPPNLPDGTVLTISVSSRMVTPPFKFRIHTSSAVAAS